MARTALTRTGKSALSKYNPQKGVKTIAAFEMAEKHFAKAKDASQLAKAIRAKLEAQAEFVYWWKTNGPGANANLGAPKGNQRAKKQR